MIERFLLSLPTILLSAVLAASALLALTRAPAPSPRGMALLFGGFALLMLGTALAALDLLTMPLVTVPAALVTVVGALATLRYHIAPEGGF